MSRPASRSSAPRSSRCARGRRTSSGPTARSATGRPGSSARTSPSTASGNIANHDPDRERKLLLKRREIDSLADKVRERGLTLVPTKLYFKNGKVKVELAVGKGKQAQDKRRDIAKRDADREIERAVKARRDAWRRRSCIGLQTVLRGRDDPDVGDPDRVPAGDRSRLRPTTTRIRIAVQPDRPDVRYRAAFVARPSALHGVELTAKPITAICLRGRARAQMEKLRLRSCHRSARTARAAVTRTTSPSPCSEVSRFGSRVERRSRFARGPYETLILARNPAGYRARRLGYQRTKPSRGENDSEAHRHNRGHARRGERRCRRRAVVSGDDRAAARVPTGGDLDSREHVLRRVDSDRIDLPRQPADRHRVGVHPAHRTCGDRRRGGQPRQAVRRRRDDG